MPGRLLQALYLGGGLELVQTNSVAVLQVQIPCLARTVGDCTVQYDYIQVVQDDCIQFCDIIKAEK